MCFDKLCCRGNVSRWTIKVCRWTIKGKKVLKAGLLKAGHIKIINLLLQILFYSTPSSLLLQMTLLRRFYQLELRYRSIWLIRTVAYYLRFLLAYNYKRLQFLRHRFWRNDLHMLAWPCGEFIKNLHVYPHSFFNDRNYFRHMFLDKITFDVPIVSINSWIHFLCPKHLYHYHTKYFWLNEFICKPSIS